MHFCYISTLVLLCTATWLNAFPTRVSRQAAELINVNQTALRGGSSQKDVRLGICNEIETRFQSDATRFEIRQSGLYHLVTYSAGDCSSNDEKFHNISQSEPVVLNKRKPVCSFMLKENEATPISVTFYNAHGDPKVTKVAQMKGDCKEICSEGDTSIGFLNEVKLTRNGNAVNNNIHLFSKIGCEPEDEISPFNKNNLVDATLEDGAVKNFRILRRI